MRGGSHLRAALLACVALGSSPCWAEASTGTAAIAVEVECPALSRDPELRAAFEARAIAELSLGSDRPGVLRVTCDDVAANVEWQPQGGVRVEQSVSVVEPPRVFLDALVNAVWKLGTEPPPAPARPAAPPEPQPPTARPPAPAPERLKFYAVGGAVADVWQGPMRGWAGPRLLAAAVYSRVSLSVGGSARWGFASVSGISLHSYDLALLLDVRLGPRPRPLEVGIGFMASSVGATAPAGLSPSDQSTLAGAVLARTRVAVETGGLRLAFGPELHVYTTTAEIRVNETRTFAIPRVTAGASLDVSLPVWP